MNSKSATSINILSLSIPFALGLFVFWLVVGFSIVNPINIGWLAGGLDPTQHYLGWVFFRQGPWELPWGLNPNFGMSISSSIAFSDSIPLLAFIFKPFSFLLSEPFQYLGIWTMLCFVMQSVFAWLLMGLASPNLYLRFLGTGLILFAPVMFWRIGVTSALVGQFLILAGLYLNLRPKNQYQNWFWALLILSSAWVHFYLLVMVLGLWFADISDRPRKNFFNFFIYISINIAMLFFALWLAGFFAVNATAASTGNYGIGRMNLLALFDSNGWSRLLPEIAETPKHYNSADSVLNHFEGFNYLGLGVIILIIFALRGIYAKGILLKQATVSHRFLLLVMIAFAMFAISNHIGLGLKEWVIPLPNKVIAFASILRASARLFWPVLYLLVLVAIFLVIRTYSYKQSLFILAAALSVQVWDTHIAWSTLRSRLSQPAVTSWDTPLKNPFWDEAKNHYDAFMRIPAQNNVSGWEILATYAAKNHWTTNSIFLSRVSELKLRQANETLEKAMATGQYESHHLYALADDKVIPALLNLNKQTDLLARINDLNILAPGWLTCTTCPVVPKEFNISAFVPQFERNVPIDFSRSRKFDLALIMVSGWDYPQPWGSWALGRDAKLVLPLPKAAINNPITELVLIARAVVSPRHPEQHVEVWVNGELQQIVNLMRGEGNQITVALPAAAQRLGYVTVEFRFPDRVRPQDIGMGDDIRELSMGLVTATFH
ncbi:hypothetical protein MCEZE4_00492 [Burkholderiaceae bacterium]